MLKVWGKYYIINDLYDILLSFLTKPLKINQFYNRKNLYINTGN